ncbi:hypothetical protein [Caldalkalibacillus thermarum]|uniref:hypothetical protein n=1 Tax=Caldalkalibacillus thermarum TaxID=296745 RepID=UPI00166B6F94|nr:hypothetical protein [Caldalkalibacillus thermarum]
MVLINEYGRKDEWNWNWRIRPLIVADILEIIAFVICIGQNCYGQPSPLANGVIEIGMALLSR